jgi:neurotransmitter:Na+ symporter, NSS family
MTAAAGSVEQWSSRWGFFLAAIGFSVGLGNIWRFPFVTGENGGSAFLIIYLACALGIGLPLLITELSIGRRGRGSSSGSIIAVASESSRSSRWGSVGTLAVFCLFIILSYYTVISGWTLDYLFRSAGGSFNAVSKDGSLSIFNALMANPRRLIFWNTVVHILVFLVVRRGVQGGIEQAVKVLMPILFLALFAMVIYGFVSGDMKAAATFLMEPDFSKVSARTVMTAIGQAFFSIGIGMGALIAFGAYLPSEYSIPKSAIGIILADTGVALLAGFAIFPLVFAFGLDPSGGSGLTFVTLPVAFGQMPGGMVFGSVFFILLFAAALSSCIGCAEGVTFWIIEKFAVSRERSTLYTVATTWIVGLITIFSLGDWSEFYPLNFIPAMAGMNIYVAMDFLAANILLLIGAMFTSVFFAWFVPQQIRLAAIGVSDGGLYRFWHFLVRFVIPPVLFVVLVMGALGL